MKRSYIKLSELLKALLTENRKSLVLENAYTAGNLYSINNGSINTAGNTGLTEPPKRAYTGNFLAGAQGSVNPGFFQ